MARGAWWATVHGVAKTKQLNTAQHNNTICDSDEDMHKLLFTIPPETYLWILKQEPSTLHGRRSLVAKWLRIPGIHCQGAASVPGWGTEILQAIQRSWKKNKKQKNKPSAPSLASPDRLQQEGVK